MKKLAYERRTMASRVTGHMRHMTMACASVVLLASCMGQMLMALAASMQEGPIKGSEHFDPQDQML